MESLLNHAEATLQDGNIEVQNAAVPYYCFLYLGWHHRAGSLSLTLSVSLSLKKNFECGTGCSFLYVFIFWSFSGIPMFLPTPKVVSPSFGFLLIFIGFGRPRVCGFIYELSMSDTLLYNSRHISSYEALQRLFFFSPFRTVTKITNQGIEFCILEGTLNELSVPPKFGTLELSRV